MPQINKNPSKLDLCLNLKLNSLNLNLCLYENAGVVYRRGFAPVEFILPMFREFLEVAPLIFAYNPEELVNEWLTCNGANSLKAYAGSGFLMDDLEVENKHNLYSWADFLKNGGGRFNIPSPDMLMLSPREKETLVKESFERLMQLMKELIREEEEKKKQKKSKEKKFTERARKKTLEDITLFAGELKTAECLYLRLNPEPLLAIRFLYTPTSITRGHFQFELSYAYDDVKYTPHIQATLIRTLINRMLEYSDYANLSAKNLRNHIIKLLETLDFEKASSLLTLDRETFFEEVKKEIEAENKKVKKIGGKIVKVIQRGNLKKTLPEGFCMYCAKRKAVKYGFCSETCRKKYSDLKLIVKVLAEENKDLAIALLNGHIPLSKKDELKKILKNKGLKKDRYNRLNSIMNDIRSLIPKSTLERLKCLVLC